MTGVPQLTPARRDVVNTQVAETDFMQQADPYRRELLAHCYRMLGSVHDAEDLVQETYLRAWKAYDNFEGRSSLRTWLHRIATTACLTALDTKKRRPLPTGLGAPASDAGGDLIEQGEVAWLEPISDDMIDPAEIVEARHTVRLAFIAALQHLPPRQRAVLVLRDVLKWKAAEVAEALELSTAAVNSILQRAHAQLKAVALSQDDIVEPDSAETRELLDRYVRAFEEKDPKLLASLFTQDAIWEMPPFSGWFQGPAAIVTLAEEKCPAKHPGELRLIPAAANGQPTLATYLRHADGVFRPFQLHVLHIQGTVISHVVAFLDEKLFETFGLPAELT
ncbi:sigma-70 family RNA polymerase sigma factor [Pseudonocardiaceae bacterium YIM PH 21723]|nr:sigma-70 family RNA polymerase sigma factor [Pseudonocardiaceae bacterium YIM PH 21723]